MPDIQGRDLAGCFARRQIGSRPPPDPGRRSFRPHVDKQRRNARRLRKEKFARLGVKASAKRETVSGSWPRLSFLVIRYRCLFFVINLYIIPVRIRWLGGCRPSRQEEPYYLILPNLHSHIPLIINDHGHHLPTS